MSSSSKIFTNATIISFNESSQSIEVLRDSDLLIEGDTITALGQNVRPPEGAERIDAEGKIITPGFVNTHSHLWQTALRTLAPNTCLAEYLFHHSPMAPITRSFSPRDIRSSTLAGYYEGLHAGVTTYVEHAHANWSLDVMEAEYEAAVEGGARVWFCAAVQEGEKVSVEEMWEWLGGRARESEKGSLVRVGLAWDFLGGMEEGVVREWVGRIKENNIQALTIHHLGAPWPTPNSGPLTTSTLSLPPPLPIIFSHAGFITPTEQALLHKHNWHLSITPESEHHYGHGQVTSRLVLPQASLGVDTNFTFSGDILTQARIALQSFRHAAYAPVLADGKIPRSNPLAVEEAFLLATRQGGLAVRRPDIGVIRVGAKADLVCWDGRAPNMAGWRDAVAAVVLHANVGDVRDVVVGGEWRKREGELVLPEGKVWGEWRGEFEEIARRVQGEMVRPERLEGKLFGVTEYGDVEVMSTRGE